MFDKFGRRFAHTALGTWLYNLWVRRLLASVQFLLLVYFVAMAYLFVWIGRDTDVVEPQRLQSMLNVVLLALFVAGILVLLAGICAFMLKAEWLRGMRYWMLQACVFGHFGAVMLVIASFGLSFIERNSTESLAMQVAWHTMLLCLLLPTGMSALVQSTQENGRRRPVVPE